MLLAEYNEAEKLALVRDNAWREGQTEGIFDTLISLVRDGVLSTKEASVRAGVLRSNIQVKNNRKISDKTLYA